MITKLASVYFSGYSDVTSSKSVKGFRSAVLTIIAGSGDSFNVGAYMTLDGTSPSSANKRAYFYKDGVKQSGNVSVTEAGIYTLIIDFDGATNLKVNISGTYSNSSFGLNLKQETYDNLSLAMETRIQEGIQSLIQSIIEKGDDACIAYTFGSWVDVTKWNSARLLITNITKLTTLSCTANPSSPRIEALDEARPIYDGIADATGVACNLATRLLDIDLAGACHINIGETHPGSQNASAYLLFSKNVFTKKERSIIIENDYCNINTTALKSLRCEVTIDGITEGNDTAQIQFSDECPAIIEDVLFNKILNVPAAGTYKFIVDCSSKDVINFVVRRATGYSIKVIPSYDDADYSVVDRSKIAYTRAFDVENIKQVELEVDAIASGNVKILGSNDDFRTTTSVSFLNIDTCTRSSSYLNLTENVLHLFANVEGYSKCRVLFTETKIYTYGAKVTKASIKVYEDYKEGLKLPYWGKIGTNWLNGYKYYKILFKGSGVINGSEVVADVKLCTAYIKPYNNSTPLSKAYDLGMAPIANNIIVDYSSGNLYLHGKAVSGGVVLEYADVMSGSWCFNVGTVYTQTGYAADCVFDVLCYTEKPAPEDSGYVKLYDKKDYEVYRLPSDSVNRDVLNKDILEWEGNELSFWLGGYNGVRYSIPFSADNVKNYVSGETIQFAYLLPFAGNRNRNGSVGNLYNASRIVVFTNTRVYHNYPYRGSNAQPNINRTDMQYFDESSIIVPQKSWQPVNYKVNIPARKKYFPVLAQYDYDQFNGRVAGTTGFVDTYGNGGLVKWSEQSPRPWLDIPISGVTYWDRLEYSNMAKGVKWCVFGNYNGKPGTEPILIATNDGGRTWFAKMYFGLTDFYSNLYGSKIDLTPITDIAGAYVSGGLRMCRRRYNVPTSSVKEPSVPFVIDENDKSLVTSFTIDADGDCLVTLADNVDYDGVCPVVYFEYISGNDEWKVICNTGFTADCSVNNGIFFRVKKVTANTYKLFADIGNQFIKGSSGSELERLFTGDAVCRHIHAVNECASGFLVSTGESYKPDYFEGGFIYHVKQTYRNGSDDLNPAPSASSTEGKVTRLCSSNEGVNRACGAYLFMDNGEPTLMYVSDQSGTFSDVNQERYASIDGRTVKVPIAPFGIFIGKLSDIDDQSKFKCVAELPLTMTGLLQTHGHFAAQGHQNAIMFSKNGYDWEIDVEDGEKINGFDNLGNIYFGNKVAVFK